MNIELYEGLNSKKDLVVTGLEGCGKSRDVIDIMLHQGILNFDTQYIVYGMSSFKLMAERQAELIKYHGLKKEECPILTLATSDSVKESNMEYIGSATRKYTKDAKIIFMSTSAIQRCHHNLIEPTTCNDAKRIGMLIIDEFNFTSTIIPKLEFIVQSMVSGSKSKKTILQFIREEYSHMDYIRYQEALKAGKNDYIVANYIQSNRLYNLPTVFITSERIPVLLLQELGFSAIDINTKSVFEGHKIHCKSDLVNLHTYNRINNANDWSMFGFSTIISDKYNPQYQLQNEIEVINHMQCRGSNSLEGNKELLTIVSNIPEIVIKNIHAAINSFSSHEVYEYNLIKSLFYRDRIMQAVGRVIGYRGEKEDVKDVWMLASNTIMKILNEYIDSGDIKIPYDIVDWEFKGELQDKWELIKNAVIEDKRITEEAQNRYFSANNIKNKNKARDILSEMIENCDDSQYITFTEIKKLLKDWGCIGITPKFVAEHFSIKPVKIQVSGDRFQVLKGIRIKQQQGE